MRVFKCLDHDEMVGSKICMSKNVHQSKMLFLTVAHLMDKQKVFKLHDFWFLKTSNNAYQLQQSESYI